MGGQNGYPVNIDFQSWMREIEKRLLHEERRPMIRAAADLMGPGLGPYTVQTYDWSGAETGFNGFFYSEPGALNSPDSSKYWIGQTQGTSDGDGYELVHSFDPATGSVTEQAQIRYFSTSDNGIKTFTPWQEAGGGSSGGSTPIGPAGGDLTGTYPDPLIDGVTFTFAVASTLWSCPHNLGKLYVQAFTADTANTECYGNLVHVNPNLVEIHFNVPMTGIARISAA